jgi:hypothetical protein
VSGILDTIQEVFDQLSNLANQSVKAFILILINIPVGAITVALVGASFDVAQTASQENPAVEAAIGGARTAYDVGGTLQDLYEYAKILAPVAGAVIGVGGAIVAVLKKVGIL